MKVKETPAKRVDIERVYSHWPGMNPYEAHAWLDQGTNRIEYSTYPRHPSGTWPWQICNHSGTNVWNGQYVYDLGVTCLNGSGASLTYEYRSTRIGAPDKLGRDPGWNSSVVAGIMDQLDLNKGESCLMYANVIQALPFLGAVTKLTSVLNNAARRFGKDLRKKPFTTAVKTLISADFVDRFVISPTIDDARKFATATNYVLNKLATAEQRNSTRFALESELITPIKSSETVVRGSANAGTLGWRNFTFRRRSYTRCVDKAYALLEATYSTDSLTPFRLWANRTGFTRPLDSAWDLLPFSFVLDYFFRGGDFIQHLSDKMSSDEGLRGTITKVHGLWGSHLYESTNEAVPETLTFSNGTGYQRIVRFWERKGCARISSSNYRRFPISNPYSLLIPFEEKLSDYLTVNLDLSSTRKRTLAELVIQAKL